MLSQAECVSDGEGRPQLAPGNGRGCRARRGRHGEDNHHGGPSSPQEGLGQAVRGRGCRPNDGGGDGRKPRRLRQARRLAVRNDVKLGGLGLPAAGDILVLSVTGSPSPPLLHEVKLSGQVAGG